MIIFDYICIYLPFPMTSHLTFNAEAVECDLFVQLASSVGKRSSEAEPCRAWGHPYTLYLTCRYSHIVHS